MRTPSRPSSKLPILAILHQETSSTGRVGQMMVDKGFALDIRRPALGDPLPDTMSGHAGAVVFGGPMSANDPDPFIKTEIDWIDVPLKENKPYLGICLGAQMLVRNLGGRVGPQKGEVTEIGWYPLRATEHGRLLMHWPKMVYHFHREGFDVPRGAKLLAEGDAYPHQAIRYGENAWGVQFHAELTRAMMHRWVVHGAERLGMPNAQQGNQHLEGRMIFDHALKDWLWTFLDIVFDRPAAEASRPAVPAYPAPING
jgi:GMP synthase (glutamine-hydrolysing)